MPVSSFRLENQPDNHYLAGQYFVVNIEVEGKKYTHHFSFSTSPTETAENGYIEFTTKLRNTDYKKALLKLKKGDPVILNAPFGRFIVEENIQKIGILTGGIGITVPRSICKYCTDEKLSTDIGLIYSTHCENDLFFQEDFEKMQSINPNLKVVYTLTHPTEAWKGYKGRINTDLVKKEIPDYLERIFYLSGPVAMVTAMEELLLSLNVPKIQLKKEIFHGY
jgi:ferredoxin-NADP reductase